ncbi:AraC family transcriptional regulator [Ihubacter massiliensis]|uniref:AraC family transcriptional regulator n=1 Tax=Hominibacterium faecale TaxID=2839743 RepID=A0A9J6QJQ8_9FIRM|nr:AraC family transcriptional regulator [Hominibacterium faecale]MCO7120794.1 AraC family transcriptional regulator [Ihubacter massiliensis]MCU7377720.1 AraC family transcriptional regulator [Hominibacterium faecale]
MQHFHEDLSLDTVAAQFYISYYHFSRIFMEETGESIYGFIKRCKIDQSQKNSRKRNLEICQICERSSLR